MEQCKNCGRHLIPRRHKIFTVAIVSASGLSKCAYLCEKCNKPEIIKKVDQDLDKDLCMVEKHLPQPDNMIPRDT